MSFVTRSKLYPPMRGQSVSRLWQRTGPAVERTEDHADKIADLQRQVRILQRALGNVISVLHPFKIYQLPSHFRQRQDPAGLNYSDSTDWLKFRVRSGAVTILSLDNTAPTAQPMALINVAGTDGCVNPDVETYLDNPLAQDIMIPAGTAAFYFWVTLALDAGTGLAGATLHYGTSPDQAAPDADDWTSFPQPDATHQMIGYADTLTFQASRQTLIRQIARADLMFFETQPITICDGNGNPLGNSLVIAGKPQPQ